MHGVLHREFFGQGWMKLEKNERTPYIMKNTKHFNDVSAASGQGQGAGAAAQPHLAQCWPGLGGCRFCLPPSVLDGCSVLWGTPQVGCLVAQACGLLCAHCCCSEIL